MSSAVTPVELSVLLVEDNASERWLYSEILRKRGHQVTACADGTTGWDAVRAGNHSLVLLDLNLPGHVDGVELCRRIRARETGAQPVILVITGDSDPGTLDRVLSAGADDYLAKPLDAHLLDIRLTVAERAVASGHSRLRAERQLERRDAEIRTLFDNLDDVFFSVDLREDRLLQISPSSQALLGVSAADLESGAVDWRVRLLPRAVLERIETGARGAPGESVVLDLDVSGLPGDARFIEARFKPEVRGGEVVRVDAVLSDVTARRTAELALAERNVEIRALAEIGDIALGARGYAETVRAVLAEVAGGSEWPIAAIAEWCPETERFRVEHAVGMDASPDAPVELPGRSSLYRSALDRGEPEVRTSKAAPDPDAFDEAGCTTIVAVPLRARPPSNRVLVVGRSDGGPADERTVRFLRGAARTLALHLDRARAEEDLRARERRARELARELGQANDELESFAYSVSHDLRSPLRTMQAFAHTLVRDFGENLPEEALHLLRRIIASGESAEELISALLDYSRLSSEEIQLHPVRLDDVVDEVLERFAGDIEASGAEVEVARPLPVVEAHHAILLQALDNLIGNALKFVPEGRAPRVRVESSRSRGRVVVTVADNGVGIPADKVSRIFRVFERLSADVHRPGTGIGLAIVRRAMERLGGSVAVESTPGEGSTFRLELPTP